jgi:hypothetical protein
MLPPPSVAFAGPIKAAAIAAAGHALRMTDFI